MNADDLREARPTRVLHLIQNLNYGGMERVLADLVNRLDPARFESHVMPLQYAGRFAADIAPTATLHDPPGQERTSLLWPRRLARAVRAVAPDVVHTHSGVWYKGARAARLARVPRIVHTEHGRHVPDPAIARFLDRAASRRTDVVVAVSEDLARTLIEGVGVSPAIVRVVPNGVAPRRRLAGGAGRPLRERLEVGRAAPIVASVGRLEPVKGYDVLMDAFARMPRDGARDDGPILVIAGDGSMRGDLAARARELGILQVVRLPGWVDDVAEVLEEADVFVLSSYSEGTSISLLEAMAAGVCPVVTDVGGNAAVLGPELRHRLVPPGDASALADALSRALGDDGARRADAAAAQARAARRYDLDRMAAGYAAVYQGEAP
ncbi:MAG TPA: glycosyltransferase [Longimicrobiales bacterium]|nr:glycosyltransferase [Longimicrobiales bacterium]